MIRNIKKRNTKYADISVEKLLSNSSDVPSGQRRYPSNLFMKKTNFREENRRQEELKLERNNGKKVFEDQSASDTHNNKMQNNQMVFLIPDLSFPNEGINGETKKKTQTGYVEHSRAEMMLKEERIHDFSRVTAYLICEKFDTTALIRFLKTHHEIEPRLYEEVLYAPYVLPLLPGSNGYSVKSNTSEKLHHNKIFLENIINKSEDSNHLYECCSGFKLRDSYKSPKKGFDTSDSHFSSSKTHEETKIVDKEFFTASDLLNNKKKKIDICKTHSELFIFPYGVIVFWNFLQIHEKNILSDLSHNQMFSKILLNPMNENQIEIEEFHFEYNNLIDRPRIYNDMISLKSVDHLVKLTMSNAIAQLTMLFLFETRMLNITQIILKLPKKLAVTGHLDLKRINLLKKSGKLFKLRADVSLSSSVLDTPNFFWSIEPSLHPLYNSVREYLEIDQRAQVLNNRCKMFLEFLDIICDSIGENNNIRIFKMMIFIIIISLSVKFLEILINLTNKL